MVRELASGVPEPDRDEHGEAEAAAKLESGVLDGAAQRRHLEGRARADPAFRTAGKLIPCPNAIRSMPGSKTPA